MFIKIIDIYTFLQIISYISHNNNNNNNNIVKVILVDLFL
jgi:hypothetical protein